MAIDIGGTFIKYGLVREDANIIEQGKTKTPETLEALIETIKQLTQKFSTATGVAISAPGAVSDKGIIYGTSALPYLHGPNIKELVEGKTNLPVYIENDANCAGYAELWNGSAKGKKDVLVVVLGTGIGGAVIKDGVLHKGANLHGGEFGYMLVDPYGEQSWSSVAATASIITRVAKAKQVEESSLTGEQIFDLADQGDQDCIQAIDEFYHMLAAGIYNLQYMFDPEIILIGGGISARSELIDKIKEKLTVILDKMKIAKVIPNLDACLYRQNANLIGAVYGFKQTIEK